MVDKMMQARMLKVRDQGIDGKNEYTLPQIPPEEIERFTIGEDLSEAERIKVLLSKLDPRQQEYVFINAINIFQNEEAMQKEIIPLIMKKVVTYSEEVQIKAGLCFFELIDQKILLEELAEPLFKVSIAMLNQWSKPILDAWIGVYAVLLPILSKKDPSRQDQLIKDGVALARKLSQLSEPIQVRTAAAILVGALAVGDSLLSPKVYEDNFLQTITNICQDFNWEVRKEICDQLLNISKYIGAEKSFEYLFPEIVELMTDEESEVAQSALIAFADLIIMVYSKDEKIMRDEKILHTFKQILSRPQLMQKEDMSRLLLEYAPMIAKVIDVPDDVELYQLLIQLFSSWNAPGDEPTIPSKYNFILKEYERMHLMMSMQDISHTYKAATIELFYIPFYQGLIQSELDGDKSLQGAKMQLAEVFHDFILNVIPTGPPLKSPQGSDDEAEDDDCREILRKTVKAPHVSQEDIESAQCEIIDQYQALMHPEQNKEVLTKALDNVTKVFVAFDDPTRYCIDIDVATFFKKKFKKQFLKLEKSIQGNWRLQKNYFEFLGKLAQTTDNKKEAAEVYVTQMLACVKGKTCSLPVKKVIAQQLANQIALVANNQARKLIHNAMMKEIAVSQSSQQRQVFLLFLQYLLPQISTRHFKQVYSDMFLQYKEEQVQQMVIQYVRLFPLARMRVSDNKLADRLDLTLRNLTSKFAKKQKTASLIAEIVEVQAKLKSREFLEQVKAFMEEEEKAFVQREIDISNKEMDEQKHPSSISVGLLQGQGGRNRGALTKKSKNAGTVSSSSLLVPSSNSQGKRAGSSRANKSKSPKAKKSETGGRISTAGSGTRAAANRALIVSDPYEESKGDPRRASPKAQHGKSPISGSSQAKGGISQSMLKNALSTKSLSKTKK